MRTATTTVALVPSLLIAMLFVSTLFIAREAGADGPPVGPLAPHDSSATPDAARALAFERALGDSGGAEEDAGYRSSRGPAGRHTTIRKVALAAGLGFAAVAVWRGAVADDRFEDYERAIFSTSASTLRRSVRDAEAERNVASALAGLAFSVTLLTFVY